MQLYPLDRSRAELGVARSTMYEQIDAGTLPKPIVLHGRKRGYPSTEIEAIKNARVAGKSDAEIRALVDALHAARRNLA
jgi:prophage regulatory protein